MNLFLFYFCNNYSLVYCVELNNQAWRFFLFVFLLCSYIMEPGMLNEVHFPGEKFLLFSLLH